MLSLPPPSAPTLGEALERLASQPGMVGALVTARDGLPVAVRMASAEAGETWSAVAAMLGNLAGRLLEEGGDEMQTAVFHAVNHQFVVRPVEVGFLLAVAQPNAGGAALCDRARAAADEVNAATRELIGSCKGG